MRENNIRYSNNVRECVYVCVCKSRAHPSWFIEIENTSHKTLKHTHTYTHRARQTRSARTTHKQTHKYRKHTHTHTLTPTAPGGNNYWISCGVRSFDWCPGVRFPMAKQSTSTKLSYTKYILHIRAHPRYRLLCICLSWLLQFEMEIDINLLCLLMLVMARRMYLLYSVLQTSCSFYTGVSWTFHERD